MRATQNSLYVLLSITMLGAKHLDKVPNRELVCTNNF